MCNRVLFTAGKKQTDTEVFLMFLMRLDGPRKTFAISQEVVPLQ